MQPKWKAFAVLSFSILTASTAQAVVLTSLEWPPYTGAALPDQGKTSQVVRAAFSASGEALTIKFLPWQRAVDEAKVNPDVVGYFPEYLDPKSSCLFSEPIGYGPLGFAQSRDKPVVWENLDDLKDKKIGVVSGYVNTQEFDNKVASNEIKVDSTNSDLQNLLKLSNGRLDLAVIDENVMNYLLTSEPKLKDVAAKINFNEKKLENKTLHVCFTDSPAGKIALQRFNDALADESVKILIK